MSSANQVYKQSGTELPFKEWLKREQLRGKLAVHEDQFYNADGGDDNEGCGCNKIIPVLIGAAIGVGLMLYIKGRK
tara:strand:- start:5903 stop:6130 length:228 start_codon:yes stop_codon:yes gene_type:complete